MKPQNDSENEQTVPGEMTGEELDQVAGGKPPSGASVKTPVKYMLIEMDQVVVSRVQVGGEGPPK